MSYLICIETANPRHQHRQQEVAAFYRASLGEKSRETDRKIMAVARNSGIDHRYSVLPDFSASGDNSFFPSSNSTAYPNLDARMAVFRKEALQLSVEAVKNIRNFESIREKVTHIITVTCTGLFAPGLDIGLIRSLGLSSSIHRSSVNFMGCNAAILAMRQAHQICSHDQDALVLIVCTELCTIHFQNDNSEDYLLSNMLFGDGSAAALVAGKKIVPDPSYKPVSIRSFQSLLIHEGANDMAWELSDRGFLMNLSSYVSGLLNGNIGRLFRQHGIHSDSIHHWAIHPGGKKILDEFCSCLSLSKEQLKSSYKVLRNFGNMSSATVLFVLRDVLQEAKCASKDRIYAAAFGPGLSIESALLEHV